MTRFPDPNNVWKDGLGIHPSTWPDSRKEGFSWQCGETLFRIQDWYRVPTFLQIPEKFQVVSESTSSALTIHPTLGEPSEGTRMPASKLILNPDGKVVKG